MSPIKSNEHVPGHSFKERSASSPKSTPVADFFLPVLKTSSNLAALLLHLRKQAFLHVFTNVIATKVDFPDGTGTDHVANEDFPSPHMFEV